MSGGKGRAPGAGGQGVCREGEGGHGCRGLDEAGDNNMLSGRKEHFDRLKEDCQAELNEKSGND